MSISTVLDPWNKSKRAPARLLPRILQARIFFLYRFIGSFFEFRQNGYQILPRAGYIGIHAWQTISKLSLSRQIKRKERDSRRRCEPDATKKVRKLNKAGGAKHGGGRIGGGAGGMIEYHKVGRNIYREKKTIYIYAKWNAIIQVVSKLHKSGFDWLINLKKKKNIYIKMSTNVFTN